MILRKNTLYNRDNKGCIREVVIWYEFDDTTNRSVIKRTSGLLTGKKVNAPDVEITEGKVKRNVLQQTELQYNSELKKYLDKGYKQFEGLDLTPDKLNELLPLVRTDANGNMKPMLCKPIDKTKPEKYNKLWLASTKLDGVRCCLYLKDNEVHTSSRGGQDYDIPATYIRQDKNIIKLLKENPGLILDGELYRFGWPLSKISGLCRKEELLDEHKLLEFHCYDIIDEQMLAKDRICRLMSFKKDIDDDSKLIIINHYEVHNIDEIQALHDEFVSQGYEGLVIRDPYKEYKCGARDTRMQKLKLFTDSEFRILGIVNGLRDEDMCFLLETEDHTQFKAKPIGDRALKQWYREHIDELIGKMATVKYFGYTTTEHPVPNLPVMRSVRDEKDI